MVSAENQSFVFKGNMPDLRARPAMFNCNTPTHLLAFFADLPSLAATGVLYYSYVIAIFKHPEGAIAGFITLERSSSMPRAMCMFDERGDHHNFGGLPEGNTLTAFLSGAGMILRDKYGIADADWVPCIEEQAHG